MKKVFKFLSIVVIAGLTSCGGGGGGGQVADASQSSSYVFQTSVLSPTPSQTTPASLTNPRFMTFDGSYLYVAGGTDNNVIRIDSNGIQTILTGFTGGPAGVAVRNGILYVTMSASGLGHGGIYSVSLSGLVNGTTTAMIPQILPNTGNTDCANCLGLIIDSDVAYTGVNGSNGLHQYSLTNQTWGNSVSISSPVTGIGKLPGNNYWVTTDYSNSVLRVFDSTWSELPSFRKSIVGGLPYGIAVASNGDVYVASYQGNSVTRIHNNAIDSTLFLDSSKVCHPTGLAIDNQAKFLYVVSEPAANGCGLTGQATGYVLKASINLSP